MVGTKAGIVDIGQSRSGLVGGLLIGKLDPSHYNPSGNHKFCWNYRIMAVSADFAPKRNAPRSSETFNRLSPD
jgi:hypothetical protein